MIYQVLMTFEAPRLVTKSELRDFIIAALETWGGQRHPDNPLSLAGVTVDFMSKATASKMKETG